MTTTASATAADFIGDYIDGRWDRINALHQNQLSTAINRDHPSVLDLLACLSPGRVLQIVVQQAQSFPASEHEQLCVRVKELEQLLAASTARISELQQTMQASLSESVGG